MKPRKALVTASGHYQRLRYSSAGDLIAQLQPIRSIRDVAKMTGLGRGTIYHTERVALTKIRQRLMEKVRGLKGYEIN